MGNHDLLFGSSLIGGKGKSEHPNCYRTTNQHQMKRALLLCATISAALVLGGCANQTTTSRTTGATEHGVFEPTAPGAGSGGGAGGGGGIGHVPVSKQP
jgi:hypothetical protein